MKRNAGSILIRISLLVIFLLFSAGIFDRTLHADDEENHDAGQTPTAEASPAPKASPGGTTESTKESLTLSEALVQGVQALKISPDAVTALHILLAKNPETTPQQFSDMLDLIQQKQPDLLKPEQIQGLKDLYRVELTNVPSSRGKEFGDALNLVLQKAAGSQTDAKTASTTPGATPTGAAPSSQPNALQQFIDQQKQASKAQQASLAGEFAAAKKLFEDLKTDVHNQEAKEDPGVLDSLRGLQQALLDEALNRDKKDGDNNTPSFSPPDGGGNGAEAGNESTPPKKDDPLSDIADLLKKKDKKGGNSNSKPADDSKDSSSDAKKDTSKQDKPSDYSSRDKSDDDDDDLPPSKPKSEPTPSMADDSQSQKPKKGPAGPPPSVRQLPPIQMGFNRDSGSFNFGGGYGGGAPQIAAGTLGRASSQDSGIFNVGGFGGGFGGSDGGRFSFVKPVGYSAAGGGDSGDGDGDSDGDGAPTGSYAPNVPKTGMAQQIVVASPSDPATSAITYIGSLSQRICAGQTDDSVGLCQTIKNRRMKRVPSEDATDSGR